MAPTLFERIRKKTMFLDLAILCSLPLVCIGLLLKSVFLDPMPFNISSLFMCLPTFYMVHQSFLVTHERYYAKTSHMKKMFLLSSLNWKYYNFLKVNARCYNGVNLIVSILYNTFNLYAIGNQYRTKSGMGLTLS